MWAIIEVRHFSQGDRGEYSRATNVLKTETYIFIVWSSPKVYTFVPCLNQKSYKDKSKIDLFSLNEKCYVWWKPNTAFQHKTLIPVIKHWGWQYHGLWLPYYLWVQDNLLPLMEL